MDITQSPIFRLNEERQAIVDEVIAREMADKARDAAAIELAINDTAYHEVARLEHQKRYKAKHQEWCDLYRTLGKRGPEEKQRILEGLIREAAWDIVGNFDPKVYRLSTTLVPKGLGVLFKSQLHGSQAALKERLTLTGHLEQLKRLSEIGTVILVPTHSSNLDSVVVGYALYELGLPPFTYGAGKNLFSNVLLSYFMRHLGAYRVDRRLKHTLYKDTLKTYSTVLLERGYHSLFFPGGGRARSNAVEQKLKLGLLGTGLSAYINNLRAGKAKPNVYVVPMTINYPLTLEADTLIDDHLKEIGKSRYIIEDDESSKLGRIFAYTKAVLAMESRTFLQVGAALDVFGNRVDMEGRSYDNRGREIDTRKYVEINGEPRHERTRDVEYTRELGLAIADAFKRNTMALATHVVAFALWQLIADRHRDMDLYHLIRLPAETALPVGVVLEGVARLRDRLMIEVAAGRILVSPTIHGESAERILEVALHYFQMHHLRPLACREGDTIRLNDLKLLYYYRNRLTGYGLESVFDAELPEHVRDEWVNV
ncbi:MAG: 1-acyl-sn-glycerol-3-phosphate acyltransferase [Candidatus Sericytochromatia bacterium]